MQTFIIYLKNQSQPVAVKADAFDFNFTPRNADEVEPKLLTLRRGDATAAVFRLEEIQGFVAPAE